MCRPPSAELLFNWCWRLAQNASHTLQGAALLHHNESPGSAVAFYMLLLFSLNKEDLSLSTMFQADEI